MIWWKKLSRKVEIDSAPIDKFRNEDINYLKYIIKCSISDIVEVIREENTVYKENNHV